MMSFEDFCKQPAITKRFLDGESYLSQYTEYAENQLANPVVRPVFPSKFRQILETAASPSSDRAYDPFDPGGHDHHVLNTSLAWRLHRSWFWRMVSDLGNWLTNRAAMHTTYVRKDA